MRLIFIAFSFAAIIFISCTPESENDAGQALPPAELLHSNYQLAEQVYSVVPEHFFIRDTLFDDSGQPGYLRYNFTARIDQVFKGSYRPNKSISFTYVVEYNPRIEDFWQSSHLFLVFLKKEPHADFPHVIETGMFALSDRMKKQIDEIF